MIPNESHIPILETPEYRVVIGIPSAGDSVKAAFAMDLATMLGTTAKEAPAIQLMPRLMRSTILPSGRQGIVASAIESDATHILWLDSDMRFPKETLLRLLFHEKDIVGVNYAERKYPYRPTARVQGSAVDGPKHELYFPAPGAAGLTKVEFMGMGVMLTRVSVFKRLAAPWFGLLYRKETLDFAGEDTFFCHHARAGGYELFVDNELAPHVKHIGEMEFDLTQSEMVDRQLKAQQVTKHA